MNHFPQRKVFLTAEWRHLVNLTYRVPADRLAPYLPDGLEPDLWEGHAHLSLVAFDFLHTRVKGLKIPFHVNFPEINLRFYVRRGKQNGVMFIREFVPKAAIAWTANLFYNEPYSRIPMRSRVEELPNGGLQVWHGAKRGGKEQTIQVEAGAHLGIPPADSPDHFFKEHDLGFGVRRNGKVLCYQVEHEAWAIREVEHVALDWDFGAVYGEKWAFLNDLEPRYKLLALGSPVKVYHPFPLADLPSKP